MLWAAAFGGGGGFGKAGSGETETKLHVSGYPYFLSLLMSNSFLNCFKIQSLFQRVTDLQLQHLMNACVL